MKLLRTNTTAVFVIAVSLLPAIARAQLRNNLMPQPAEILPQAGALSLDSTFAVKVQGVSDTRLTDAINRAVLRIEKEAALRHAGGGVAGTTKLIVKVDHHAAVVQSVDDDETYSLSVTPTHAEIDAPTELGAMHGLETLVQLVQPSGNKYVLPAITIHDAPRFRWRGLMIDCGRHFEPVDVIKRTLDGMAAVKLNVFHWHLTEDQGFRIQSLLYPKLTAAGSDGFFYTQQDAREIVSYARARGIRVVPEFEMPGHTTAWLVAYPDLASGTAPNEIRRKFGVSQSAIDPTRESTYVFIDRFLTEMATIFPDAYVHIGGDEVPAPDWKTNPHIIAFMKAHNLDGNEALQAYFNARILKIITRLHKHMMGWDEILTTGLPKDIVVQSWRGAASLSKGAKLGYSGVLSAPYYLDHMQSASEHYLADPIPTNSDLTSVEHELVLGGEICMWGEHVDAHTIQSRIWPRSAAIAERFWSPQNVRDVDDMYRRLVPISVELEGLGLTHLQQEDADLRNLAATENIDALRTFASVLEPIGFHGRTSIQRPDQLTPLDGFVDAIRPDPISNHDFQFVVKRFLAHPQDDLEDKKLLDDWFTRLSDAIPTVQQQIRTSPRLADLSTQADQLRELTEIGQESLLFLSKGEETPDKLSKQQMQQLKMMNEPGSLVRFTILQGVGELVQAASRNHQTTAPSL